MKTLAVIFCTGLAAAAITLLSGCAASNVVRDKTGVQLWGENCNRCHNIPSPVDFSDAQWKNIGTHMKVRANLTRNEIDKIIDFMQSSN
ncbi:MAG TPA: cytochrome c [Bacteroidia bacterium]|nr:cytochrome c [Bacteroidia bacterium]